jgi:SAM-dependent methyltransferase
MSPSDSLSFDGLVELYDQTRCVDERCFAGALDYLAGRFPVDSYPRLFEPGIGTGRIAVPLARRGYRVTGVDLSQEMLDALRTRLRQNAPGPAVTGLQADIVRLPFPPESFHLAVAVHVFYFIRDWRKAADEVLRVVRRGGFLILMHTGTGMEIPELNERYKEFCSELGFHPSAPGVKSTRDVADHYQALGCAVEWVRKRWTWTARIPLERAVDDIRRRAYSFTVPVPEEIHRKAVRQLSVDMERRYHHLETFVEIPNRIYMAVVQKVDGERP